MVWGLDINEAWVVGREEVWDAAPAGGDNGEAAGHGFDDDEAETFAVVEGGETKDVSFGEELGFVFGVGETGVADGGRVAEALEGLAEEVFGFGIGKWAGNGECEFEREMIGAAEAVGLADAFNGVEHAFFAGTKAEEEDVGLDAAGFFNGAGSLHGDGAGVEAFAPEAQDLGKIWAGIGNAVWDDDGAAGFENGGVGLVEASEGDREMGAIESEVRDSLHEFRLFFDPFTKASGVPVENYAAEKRAEEKEDDAIAIERGADGRRGDVVEVGGVVAEAEPEGFGAVGEEAKDFAEAEFSDVVAGFGELRVDVKDLDGVLLR